MDNIKINTCGCAKTAGRVARKRELAAEDPRIGKMPDPQLAVYLGVSKATVRKARIGLGIPKFNHYKHDRADEILAQDDLGGVPDRIIAERLGVAHSYVQRVRAKNYIRSTVGKNIGANHSYIEKPNEVAQLMRLWR